MDVTRNAINTCLKGKSEATHGLMFQEDYILKYTVKIVYNKWKFNTLLEGDIQRTGLGNVDHSKGHVDHQKKIKGEKALYNV